MTENAPDPDVKSNRSKVFPAAPVKPLMNDTCSVPSNVIAPAPPTSMASQVVLQRASVVSQVPLPPATAPLHLEREPAICEGSPELLGQVVTNLLTDAIHHGRRGGVGRVRTGAGDGMATTAAADAAQIFGRFFRVDKARTAAAGHTGLGLAITKAIVEARGGTLSMASVVG